MWIFYIRNSHLYGELICYGVGQIWCKNNLRIYRPYPETIALVENVNSLFFCGYKFLFLFLLLFYLIDCFLDQQLTSSIYSYPKSVSKAVYICKYELTSWRNELFSLQWNSTCCSYPYLKNQCKAFITGIPTWSQRLVSPLAESDVSVVITRPSQ